MTGRFPPVVYVALVALVIAFAWYANVVKYQRIDSSCARACSPAFEAAERCALELSVCHARNASPCLPAVGPVEAPQTSR